VSDPATDRARHWPRWLDDGVRAEIEEAYADPSRGYHDTRHLTEVLDRLGELAGHGATYDATPVLLAAWFHDAVYDGERDAEERSATWAEDSLGAVAPAPVVAEVARLVRLTETHTPDDGDANGCALSDADLGILAAPRERYDDYVAAVRREYAHLEDAVFDAGRADVLRGLAAKPRLFHTDYAREKWEAAARANLERELAALDDSSAV
jgi:predicted metal-dependent HD superfamily phosphohydrolase